VFGFFVQKSPAKLGTPLAVGFCYVSSVCFKKIRFDSIKLVCSQVAPCCLDHGANPRQCVGGLDKHMIVDLLGGSKLSWELVV
jgi:hypothetical protein